MLGELLCSLFMLSIFVNARPSSTLQLFDGEQAPATNGSNPTYASFEVLSREGWRRMRLPTPFTELKLISALPVNQEPSAATARIFRHVVIVGYETSRRRWLHICNRGGRNDWEPVRQIPSPPVIITSLPSWQLEDFEYSFEAAFRQVRRAGFQEPWAEVRLSAEEFPVRTGEISYIFLTPGFRHGALVDAQTGVVQRVDPPGTDTAGFGDISSLDLRNLTSDYTVVETS